jgi:undecaprenyl pyrophosphate phosphatase UppP
MNTRTTLDRPAPRHRSTNASGPTRTRGGLPLIRFSRRRRRVREPGNTSAFIRVWALIVAVVVAALAVLLTYDVHQENTGLTVIGHQTAPVVEASTDLYLRLNDMDAQMANILLVGSAMNLGFTRAQALGIFQSDRRQASIDLQEASAEATVDPAAAQSIRALLDALGSYEALASQVTLVSGEGSQAPGRPSSAVLALYTQATDLLRAQLLPASQDLTNRNAAILQSTYVTDRGKAITARNWVFLIGVVVLVAVIALQVYLARRFHRWINPAMAAATLIAAALVIAGVRLTSGEAQNLYVAKVEAFNSILPLDEARAVSYDANADESRYLVDAALAAQYQRSFLTKTLELVDLPGAGIYTFDKRFAAALSAYQQSNNDIEWHGYWGDEFRNFTFVGEPAAAELSLKRFQVYELDDRIIRKLNNTGHLVAAIAFDTSYNKGESNWAFGQYDNAQVEVITINVNAFNQAIKDGLHALDGWTVIPAVAGLAVLGLLLLGLRGRLAEYRMPIGDSAPVPTPLSTATEETG